MNPFDAAKKLERVIRSCVTKEQLRVAQRMIKNFYNTFGSHSSLMYSVELIFIEKTFEITEKRLD